MFVKMEDGRYVNFDMVSHIRIDGDCDVVVEFDEDWRVWRSFKTKEEAQEWLDHEMRKYHGIA